MMIYYRSANFYKNNNIGYNSGFSLIELLTTLLLVSILLFILLPNWRDLRAANAANQAVKRLGHILVLARQHALLRSYPVSVCSGDKYFACGSNWSDNYLIFLDPEKKSQPETLATILLHDNSVDTLGYWRVQAFTSQVAVTFNPDGSTFQNSSFIYCPYDKNPHYARGIYLSQTGRIRFSTDNNGDGIDEDSQGQPLSCG